MNTITLYTFLFVAGSLFAAVVLLVRIVFIQLDKFNKLQEELLAALLTVNHERRMRQKAEKDLENIRII